MFITTYRRGVLYDDMPTRSEQVMGEVCADFGAPLWELYGEPDHVHLLVHHPPTFALSRLVNSLRGVSSRRLRQEYVGQIDRARTAGHVWSSSSFAASCGGAPLEILKECIRGQQHPDQAGASSRA